MNRLLAAILAQLPGARRDDVLLDRLGSATPGEPASDLDALALAWRNEIETPPYGDLVDIETATAAIQAGAA